MDVYSEILELESLCRDLDIPEYTENLTGDEICCIVIGKLKSWLVENRDEIYQNIHEGEENDQFFVCR